MKKILKITGITFLILILIAFLIPVLFKKQIQALVKNEINKTITATVEFSDVKLSLFRHFPKVGIIIEDLTIIGTGEFEKDTLIAAKKVDGAVGLFSIIKGEDIKVSSITFDSPRIHLLNTKDGNANWDITRKSTDTTSIDTSASNFRMTLKKYQINDGYLLFRDEQAGTFTEVFGLDHTGSGNLTADVFTLSTNTKAASASFTQDNIPYLFETKADIQTDIKIDNTTNTYTFNTDDILLNNLTLAADGFIQMVNDSTFNMDMRVSSPSNDFKDILSMIPAMYTEDFSSVKTSGTATFNGFVKGTYTPQQMPAYNVDVEIKDGSFQYPDLPKPVKNIQLLLNASNIDGQPDNTVIDISKGHLEMDDQPFDFRFIYKNPITTKFIDAAAKGNIDLSQLTRFIKLPAGTKLAGLVAADAFIKGPSASLMSQSGNFSAGGFFNISNLFYSDSKFPQPIKNGNIKATIENSGGIADNTSINVSSAHIEVGNDPVDFSLLVKKPFSSIDFSGHAKGSFTLDNIKQFTKLEPGTAVSGKLNADLGFSGNNDAIKQEKFDEIVLNGNAGLSNVKFVSADYPKGVIISSTQLNFNGRTVSLSQLNGNYLGSNFSATGVLNNLVGFAIQDQELSGNLNVKADKINLNDWMGTTESSTTPTAQTDPFLVPANINFTINAFADNVRYDKVDYNNVNGTLILNDEKATLKDIKTNVLGGTAIVNGSYSTKLNKTEPDIGLTYDIKNVDVQKAFQSYVTIQSLMPIGKFLAGKLSSQLSLTGNLNGSMMPDLNSLSGKGNLLLLQGVLQKFAPLEKLASALQIDRLKSISVKDIKNYIEFANGKVMVKPFTIKVDQIELEIAGFHGFDQSMDYAIQMKLPRSVLGTKGNNLVNGLFAKANSKGIPIKPSETVNLSVKMTGSISNPNVGIDLKEIAGDALDDIKEQAKDFVQGKIDSTKQKVKDSLNAVKQQVTDKLKDKLKEKILGKDTTNSPAQDTAPKPKTTIKNTIKDILNRNKNKTDTTKKN